MLESKETKDLERALSKSNDEDYYEDTEKKRKKKKSKPPQNTLIAKVKDNPLRTVNNIIAISDTALNERVAVWQRYRRKYRRGLTYLKNISKGMPLYFTNYLFANVESMKANMTRNLPPLTASPRGFRDDLAADLMTRALQDTLERGNLQSATREVVHNGLLATMAYYKVFYSHEKDNVQIDAIAPENMLVDPAANTLEDARWIIHKKDSVSVDEIYAEYGVVPENPSEGHTTNPDVDDNEGLYTSTENKKAAREQGSSYDVYEAWFRDWSEDRENDWYIVTIAGNTTLRSEYSIYDHNMSPFVVWFAGEDYGADNIYYRGIGAIEEVEPLQDRVDSMDLKIHKHISLLANRQRFVSSQSGLSNSKLDNTEGRTYTVNGDPSRAVYYDSPPQMGMEVYNFRDATEMLIQTVSGMFDVTQGRRPTGITAGRAIESLKDSAETRLAALVDTLAESIAKVGNLTLQIMLQMYDSERLIKSTDGDEDKDFIIIPDYPEELQPQPTPMLGEMGEMLVDEETGGYQFDPNEELEVTPELEQARKEWKEQNGIALVLSEVTYDWDIRANTDTALPSAKAERGQMASDLFRLGAIDREALLEALDFPQRHKILQRLAAEATGKSAGKPEVEGDPMMEMIAQLEQMGLPPEMVEQLVQQMQGGGQQQQQQGGNFPPQMTI